jgi:hypothetical protein
MSKRVSAEHPQPHSPVLVAYRLKQKRRPIDGGVHYRCLWLLQFSPRFFSDLFLLFIVVIFLFILLRNYHKTVEGVVKGTTSINNVGHAEKCWVQHHFPFCSL